MEQNNQFNEIQFLRDNSDFSWNIIGNKGHLELSKKFGVNLGAVNRIVDESRILSFFPKLHKSKSTPLARIRNNRELLLFAQKYNIYKLQVREIYKLVKEWRRNIEINPKILLTDLQHDLIIGSTIGDANIRQRNRNCMFRVSHSQKQKKYVEWKFNILREFDNSTIKLNQKFINGRLINTFEFNIDTHYMFNYYRKLFYSLNGNKIVTKELLNQINPRSLAIWLCDDGSYCQKQKYIIFCTNSFNLEEHKLMKKYFENKWNLSPTIGFRDNKYYYLRFKKEDTAKLVEIVRPFVPKFMKYKIGEENE
ncbi:MAG TPA: hypothetical protein VJI68_00680 [Candidatus Nanoarchaeia archaeon]|nr:hypothetical protein [Candidatus Nanoarchaeia archaeon]